MGVCLERDLAACSKSPRYFNRRNVVAAFVLAGILGSGSTSAYPQSGGRIGGPSGGQVAGAAVGVGAAIAIVTAVAINHGHHSVTGCAFSGPGGMKLKAGDSKVYAVEGDASSIKAGDKVKVHGSRVKKTKDADQGFNVDRVSKDYGPCHVDVARSPSGTP